MRSERHTYRKSFNVIFYDYQFLTNASLGGKLACIPRIDVQQDRSTLNNLRQTKLFIERKQRNNLKVELTAFSMSLINPVELPVVSVIVSIFLKKV